MANPLRKMLNSPGMQVTLLRLRVVLAGLAMDYWKDEPFSWPFARKGEGSSAKKPSKTPSKPPVESTQQEAEKPDGPQPWSADRIQIMEKMWGEGHSFPGNDRYVDHLVTPLGMNKEMSVLDLNAGLGGMARKIAVDFGSYVTGFDMDQTVASRGMIMSIAAGKAKQASITAYNPETFTASRKYDCIFARELFFKIIAKEKLFNAISGSIKSGGGQLVFTDYLLDSVSRQKPAIQRWFEKEPSAAPLTLPETIKYWKGFGFDMRVAEDQTDTYRDEILKGLAEFVSFLSLNIPDKETKGLILNEIDFWGRRVAAMKQGLKYYRFYGIKY